VSRFCALVLAGSRGGPDPLAEAAGVPHKALIHLEGRTLLERVVSALQAAGAARIAVSANDPHVRAAAEALGVEVIESAAGPSLSVEQGARVLGFPLLVTTSDHALLEPEWVRRFLADAPPEADICALLARREVVEAAAPATRRTYLRLADGWWSGCNLFYLANPDALRAVDFWKRLEAERKRPWRMAAILGPGVLLAFLTRRLSLDGAVARLGRVAGVRAVAVASPYGLAAVDVDKVADLELVRQVVGEA
jgi:GTP:adenosylcobinamide-phosphate guanylyltransferase